MNNFFGDGLSSEVASAVVARVGDGRNGRYRRRGDRALTELRVSRA
jgi:hypothetical protein